MKIALPLLALSAFLALPATGQETKRKNITLTEIEGRSWLVGPDGKPFFAHGITHVGGIRGKVDFAKFSMACKELGFNAYGYGCPPALKSDMPYIESWNHLVPISTYRGDGSLRFVDVFDPAEQARLEKGVKMSCAIGRENPLLIGYCWTDLGAWPLENPTGKNWVHFIRSLPEDAPGRKACAAFLSSWKGDDDTARDLAFLRLIAREYFRVVGGAQKKYDPDHLVFGDRFAFNTLVPEVLEEMLPYVDAIAIQPNFRAGFPKAQYDEIHALTGKPILLCDFAIRFRDGDRNIRGYKPEADSIAAGKAYADYLRAALETNYIIGSFWCNPLDSVPGFNKTGVKQGFFGDGMTLRPGLSDAVREVNAYRDELTPEG